jgi:alpha-tubulin suppressor-like RCC1 family protein
VAAGSLHSLAVRADGSVWSWGWNSFGQLGDGTAADRHLPVPVAGLGGVRTVAAGWYHSLALRTEGTVVAWGLGHVGQVDGSISSASSLVPLAVPWVTGAVAIAAGGFHSLALTTGGHVVGWGWNRFGQLATSTDFDRVGPNELDVLDHAAVIGAGAYHSLVAYRFGT